MKSDTARTRLVVALVFGLAALWLAPGCRNREYADSPDWMSGAFEGDEGYERIDTFQAELADATARYDYTGIDPAEVAHGRNLGTTHCGGRSFRRYVIDGKEASTHTHEALQTGRKGSGRSVKLPYFFDPNDRFVVVRYIFKVEDRWEVIVEEWVLLPPPPKCRDWLETLVGLGEFAGAEDMLGHSSAGRGVGGKGFQPRGFKTSVKPIPRGQAGKAGKAGKTGKAAQAAAKSGSGLSVVPRFGMKGRAVKDIHGRDVIIWGQTRSSSLTPGHDMTMEAEALEMARSGKYEYITVQRSWRTATGRVGKSRKMPDIIGVRRDGKVDAVEVRSRTDKHEELKQRLEKGMESLPPERHGQVRIIDPR